MERTLMKGNEAVAEAAIRAGCKCYFGYPITPQNEITAYMSKVLPQKGGSFVQAESEIGAINMVYGAAAAGIRTMTSSSSPGISLKAEGMSYLVGSDLPCVVVNVQRGGPGLGSIQPSQADYWQATKAMGHGDMRVVTFAPCSVQEMVDTVIKSFDIADAYRIPVMILVDGLLGQMMEPVTLPDITPPKVTHKWATSGHENKREHNTISSLYLHPHELEKAITDRFAKYDIIKEKHTEAELYMTEDADVIVTAYGATARVAKPAVMMAREQGIKAGFIRPITVWPFPDEDMRKVCANAKAVLCTEMSMGQMVDDVKLAINCEARARFVPVEFYGRTGGSIPSPEEILEQIKRLGGAK